MKPNLTGLNQIEVQLRKKISMNQVQNYPRHPRLRRGVRRLRRRFLDRKPESDCCKASFKIKENEQPLLPLPAGEGRGEGESFATPDSFLYAFLAQTTSPFEPYCAPFRSLSLRCALLRKKL
jgi:hypothetical protein